jgi:hypothetical protein
MEALEESVNVMQSCPTQAAVQQVLVAADAASQGTRRSRDLDTESSSQEHMEKRLRVDDMSDGEDSSSDDRRSGGKENFVVGWATNIVKSLHGCPSVEEAVLRCSRHLTDIEAEVRQTTLSEVEVTSNKPPQESEEVQAAQKTSRILMRAVKHLAERCKRNEGNNDEIAMLRQSLEQSQDENRRLQHSNEVLKGHLRLYLDNCSSGFVPWGSAVH